MYFQFLYNCTIFSILFFLLQICTAVLVTADLSPFRSAWLKKPNRPTFIALYKAIHRLIRIFTEIASSKKRKFRRDQRLKLCHINVQVITQMRTR
jgi:hypothetical protein